MRPWTQTTHTHTQTCHFNYQYQNQENRRSPGKVKFHRYCVIYIDSTQHHRSLYYSCTMTTYYSTIYTAEATRTPQVNLQYSRHYYTRYRTLFTHGTGSLLSYSRSYSPQSTVSSENEEIKVHTIQCSQLKLLSRYAFVPVHGCYITFSWATTTTTKKRSISLHAPTNRNRQNTTQARLVIK